MRHRRKHCVCTDVNPRPRKLHLLRHLPRWLVLTECSAKERALYLSFDDGPHPEHTPRLLDLLKKHGARATFFLIGRKAEKYPEVVRRIVAEGHLLGNHSYSHPAFAKIAPGEQADEIDRTDRILAQFDGLARHPFRPPSGALPMSLVMQCVRKRRRIAYWSYDSMDYRRDKKDMLLERLRGFPPTPGDIVLMHDDDDEIVHALEELIPEWRAAGFALPALPAEAA
ncbi:MAG TPA: polysaccharide deacetylase family protein [Rhodanobacteraceae bacterium]|nr:polysaccharide deacetylase family protein [Rhodanobacteraceae bacterium]